MNSFRNICNSAGTNMNDAINNFMFEVVNDDNIFNDKIVKIIDNFENEKHLYKEHDLIGVY